jgi:hypothetical protein
MTQGNGSRALTLALMLAMAPALSAAPKPPQAKMTGAQLVRDMLADPFANDVNFVRRERAMGYIDGVMDSSIELQWCPAGKSVPHELNYIVTEEISGMPAAKLNGSAASLVRDALARLFPCRTTGAKS